VPSPEKGARAKNGRTTSFFFTTGRKVLRGRRGEKLLHICDICPFSSPLLWTKECLSSPLLWPRWLVPPSSICQKMQRAQFHFFPAFSTQCREREEDPFGYHKSALGCRVQLPPALAGRLRAGVGVGRDAEEANSSAAFFPLSSSSRSTPFCPAKKLESREPLSFPRPFSIKHTPPFSSRPAVLAQVPLLRLLLPLPPLPTAFCGRSQPEERGRRGGGLQKPRRLREEEERRAFSSSVDLAGATHRKRETERVRYYGRKRRGFLSDCKGT